MESKHTVFVLCVESCISLTAGYTLLFAVSRWVVPPSSRQFRWMLFLLRFSCEKLKAESVRSIVMQMLERPTIRPSPVTLMKSRWRRQLESGGN